jgi:hypothetical protein
VEGNEEVETEVIITTGAYTLAEQLYKTFQCSSGTAAVHPVSLKMA